MTGVSNHVFVGLSSSIVVAVVFNKSSCNTVQTTRIEQTTLSKDLASLAVLLVMTSETVLAITSAAAKLIMNDTTKTAMPPIRWTSGDDIDASISHAFSGNHEAMCRHSAGSAVSAFVMETTGQG